MGKHLDIIALIIALVALILSFRVSVPLKGVILIFHKKRFESMTIEDLSEMMRAVSAFNLASKVPN